MPVSPDSRHASRFPTFRIRSGPKGFRRRFNLDYMVLNSFTNGTEQPERFMRSVQPLAAVVSAIVILTLTACGGNEYPVHSSVSGTFSVRAEIDSTGNHEGFRVSVLGQRDGDVDTLGTAVTATDGSFAFEVKAPEAGIYPISVERNGSELALGEFVAVDQDTVVVTAIFPLGARRLRIVSRENASWMAYRNAKTQHNQSMAELIGAGRYTSDMMEQIITQTSSILWNIQNTYDGTIGGNLAKAESVIMMEGWNDSLVVARYLEVASDNESVVEVARAARRSVARLQGGAAALNLLSSLMETVREDKKAGIMAEMVVAFADSNRSSEAVETASELRRQYPDSPWAEWAVRATYDLENLQPGMEAPAFDVTDREGEQLTSSTLLDNFIILEFFDPLEPIYQREFAKRNYLAGALPDQLFRYVSVSVETDEAINEALFEEQDHPGYFVWSADGMASQIARDFNVHVIPTRFLIDPDGRVVAKYTGPALDDLESDLITIINSYNQLAEQLSQQQ